MSYKNGKWASQILSMQLPDGSWGNFHTLRSNSGIYPMATEQALFRLELLGYTEKDACIQNAIAYMEKRIHTGILPESKEKTSDFETFVDLVLAAWIRRFTCGSDAANKIAKEWATIITAAFQNGIYDQDAYNKSYLQIFGRKPKGGRLVDFVNFYPISLLVDMLDENTENLMLDYIIQHKNGIYYIYEDRLDILPTQFQSKQASRYLGAVELLYRYRYGRKKLAFVLQWLKDNQSADGTWNMGSLAKDGMYFPLSDRWTAQACIADSTYRIGKLLSLPCYCGHDCSRCVTYIATQKDDDTLREQSQKFYRETFGITIPLSEFYCFGGRSDCIFELCRDCPFRSCCRKHKVEQCSACPEYPCEEIREYQTRYVNQCNQI